MVSRDSSGATEIGYGKRQALGAFILGAMFFGLVLVVVESTVARVSAIVGLALTVAGLARIASPRPQVILSAEEIVVGGRWTSAATGRRRARWQQVESVGPIGLAPPFRSMQGGRVPTYPGWMERLLPSEFHVECEGGRSLVVREPLDQPLRDVRVEVLRRIGTPSS